VHDRRILLTGLIYKTFANIEGAAIHQLFLIPELQLYFSADRRNSPVSRWNERFISPVNFSSICSNFFALMIRLETASAPSFLAALASVRYSSSSRVKRALLFRLHRENFGEEPAGVRANFLNGLHLPSTSARASRPRLRRLPAHLRLHQFFYIDFSARVMPLSNADRPCVNGFL